MLDYYKKEPQFPHIPSLDWDILCFSGWQGSAVTSSVLCIITTYLDWYYQTPWNLQRGRKEWPSASHNQKFSAPLLPIKLTCCYMLSSLNVFLAWRWVSLGMVGHHPGLCKTWRCHTNVMWCRLRMKVAGKAVGGKHVVLCSEMLDSQNSSKRA